MSSNLTLGNEGNLDDSYRLRAHYKEEWETTGSSSSGISEIEEDFSEESDKFKPPLSSIREDVENSSVFSFDIQGDGNNVVYVVIGNKETTISMDALVWTLDNLVIPSSTVVFLIHVFPETKFIPTPLGKLQISQVNPEQRENHMAQERGKRRELLQKFLNVCSDLEVKVDTILIESDLEAKAILDLIPILNIRKLVLGTTKSNARRLKSKRGNGGVTDQILQGAPEFCEVKIVCEGKEMCELTIDSPSPAQSPRVSSARTPKPAELVHEPNQITPDDSTACGCFKI